MLNVWVVCQSIHSSLQIRVRTGGDSACVADLPAPAAADSWESANLGLGRAPELEQSVCR